MGVSIHCPSVDHIFMASFTISAILGNSAPKQDNPTPSGKHSVSDESQTDTAETGSWHAIHF